MRETPHAYIVLPPGEEVTEEDLIQFSRSKLAHFKAIIGVTFLEELPKTASGKILKVHLRNEHWKKAGKADKLVN